MMVRDFQSIIGIEAKKQIIKFENKLPNLVIACISGGSNALGLFFPFLNERSVKIIGVEAGGKGVETKSHAASLSKGNQVIFMEISHIYFKTRTDKLWMLIQYLQD